MDKPLATESNPASLDIPAIRAMAEAATPGPWRASHYDDGSGLFDEGCKVSAPDGTLDGCIVADLTDDEGLRGAREDAEFIAACRTAVPLLCDRIDEQAREIERLRNCISELDTIYTAGADIDRYLTELVASVEDAVKHESVLGDTDAD